MKAYWSMRGRAWAAIGALLLVCGCEALSALAGSTDEAEPDESPGVQLAPPVEEPLPERPDTSTARSETGVITFQSVLENREMTREERIAAFEKLGPAALQKPVARANVSGAPAAAPIERSPQRREPTKREVASARQRVPVVMYSTAWCGVCKRARAYFQQNGIAFEEHDVDEEPLARAEYQRLNPRRSVPTMKIGDEVVIGFSPAAVERALDAAARKRFN